MDDKNGEQDSNGETKEGEPAKAEERRQSVSAPDTSDPVRLKCRELLSNALKTDGKCKIRIHVLEKQI